MLADSGLAPFELLTFVFTLCRHRNRDLHHGLLGFLWSNVVSSLNLLAGAIRRESPRIALSVGSGFHEHSNLANGTYDPVDIDAWDFHSHSQKTPLQCAQEFYKQLPVVIGELGCTIPYEWARDQNSWEEIQRRLTSRLHEAVASRVTAVFLWFLGELGASDPEALVYGGREGAVLRAISDLQRCGWIADASNALPSLHQICASALRLA